jgi:integrase/recombinase XerD
MAENEVLKQENTTKAVNCEVLPVKKKELRAYLDRDTVNERIASIKNSRDRMLMMFLWMSGCRITEALNVRKRDIDFTNKEARIRWLKSRKWEERILPLRSELAMALWGYSASMNLDDLIFPIDRFRAYVVCKKYMKVSPHKLRHSFAINFIRQTQDYGTLRKLLGHKRADTTLIYSTLAPEEQAKALNEVKM